ncbi:mite group 2 allergen Der f 2 [Anoplophora glabripennis]|uniref:mite group 2 allergen Der f 2 n=1 Tax=Anoplophora glabripennis TaxID=217634 RepID=UPI0008758F2E|nr:mite group 2 allergen Der f 2 [Anoplophora glabripennis]
MKVLASLILLVLVNYAYSADTTDVASCHDVLLPEVKISVDDVLCELGPCVVSPGAKIYVEVSFDTPVKLENVKPKMTATVLGLDVDLPLNQDNACDGLLNTECPVEVGGHVDYAYTYSLTDVFPEVTATLTINLLDEDNDNAEILCFSIEVQVKKS